MFCILCVTASDNILQIFDENGLRLDIRTIITKHFWLQPREDDYNAKVICCNCWDALNTFHKFYQAVAEAHAKFNCMKPSLQDAGNTHANLDYIKPTFEEVVEGRSQLECIKPAFHELDILGLDDKRSSFQEKVETDSLKQVSPEITKHNTNLYGLQPIYEKVTETNLENVQSIYHVIDKNNSSLGNLKPTYQPLVPNQPVTHLDAVETTLNGLDSIIRTSSQEAVPVKLHTVKSTYQDVVNTGSGLHNMKPNYQDLVPVKLDNELHSTVKDGSQFSNFDSIFNFLTSEVPLDKSQESKDDPEQAYVQVHVIQQVSITPNQEVQFNNIQREPIVLEELSSESNVPMVNLRSRAKLKEYDQTRSNSGDSDISRNGNEHQNETTDDDSEDDSQNSAVEEEINANIKNNNINNTPPKMVSCREFDSIIKEAMELKCEKCNEPASNFAVLKQHYWLSHEEPVRVTCCGKQYHSRAELVHHILLHRNPDSFKCHLCGRIMANKKTLGLHIHRHLNQERKYQCNVCTKSFNSKKKIERHSLTHEKGEQICESCGKIFRDKQSLKLHQQRDHSEVPRQKMQCQKCGVYLADISTLKTHMKYQHPEKEEVYKCDICGKISTTGYGLKRHKLYMHKYENTHKCKVCDKGFKTLQKLRPNSEDCNAKVICFSCWSSLDSFHKFYQTVEEAHINLANIKPPINHDTSDAENFDTYPDLFVSEDMKFETLEEPEVEIPSNNIENPVKNERIEQDVKSDCDSDIPLLKLSSRKKKLHEGRQIAVTGVSTRQKRKIRKSTDDESEYKAPKSKRKQRISTDDESEYKAPESKGKRKITNEAEVVTTNRVPCKQFDSFIQKNMKLSCEICHEPKPTFMCLKKHYRSVHKKECYVHCCDKKFESRHALVQHLMLHQNPDFFKCNKCDKVFKHRKALRSHTQTHDQIKQVYKCDECGRGFSNRFVLERHVQAHLKPHLICEHCGMVTADNGALKRHQLREHSNEPRVKLPCTKCGVFLYKAGLSHHMKNLHPEVKVTHVCKICGKTSPTEHGLRSHIRYNHEWGLRHKCPMCEKGFKAGWKLRVSTNI